MTPEFQPSESVGSIPKSDTVSHFAFRIVEIGHSNGHPLVRVPHSHAERTAVVAPRIGVNRRLQVALT